jgi:hypothetical protein
MKWLIAVGLVVAMAPAAFAGNASGGGAHKAGLFFTDSKCDDMNDFGPSSTSTPAVGFAILNSTQKPGTNGGDLIANIQLMNGDPGSMYMVSVCSNTERMPVPYGVLTTDANGHGHLNASMPRATVSGTNPDQFFVQLDDGGMTPQSKVASTPVTVD